MTERSHVRGSRPFQRIDVGLKGSGYSADWSDEQHHFRRLASEFIGTFGFVFALSACAGAFHAYAQPPLSGATTVIVLTMSSATWLVIAIYALGDLSAHFNPAVSFAYALRGDMSWKRAGAYWIVQCVAAAAASLCARGLFGAASGLAAVQPPPGQVIAPILFEAFLTGSFVLLVLAMTGGPKLNGPFTPLAIGAFVLSYGTMGGLFEGAAFNPARAFGPDLAIGRMSSLWIYLVGDFAGAALAVLVDLYLRGAPNVAEARIAESEGS